MDQPRDVTSSFTGPPVPPSGRACATLMLLALAFNPIYPGSRKFRERSQSFAKFREISATSSFPESKHWSADVARRAGSAEQSWASTPSLAPSRRIPAQHARLSQPVDTERMSERRQLAWMRHKGRNDATMPGAGVPPPPWRPRGALSLKQRIRCVPVHICRRLGGVSACLFCHPVRGRRKTGMPL